MTEDEKYFSEKALSKSQIKHWDPKNPMSFWKRCAFNPKKEDIGNTDYTATGKLSHMLLFEREKIQDTFEVRDDLGKSRDNKKWKSAQSMSKKIFLTSEELHLATLMTNALLKHQLIRDILKYAKVEAPFMWEDKEWGIPCKMKTDAETGSEEGIYCIDLKTTAKEFPRYIDKEGYQYEIGFYSRGLRAKYKQPLKKFIHIIQSSKEGEENKISVKVTEGAQLEACELEVDAVVRQVAQLIKEWKNEMTKAPKYRNAEKIWLPELSAEPFEISPWHDRELAEKLRVE